MEIVYGDKCSFHDCKSMATELAYSRKLNEVVKLCDYHLSILKDGDRSEYVEYCPNCGCYIPVN